MKLDEFDLAVPESESNGNMIDIFKGMHVNMLCECYFGPELYCKFFSAI